ncbi:hypothetical protein BHE74_00049605 [Ensete ventricosum]|nr:hypothetical protein BHE74_00049605 [Ensete ventricosum]
MEEKKVNEVAVAGGGVSVAATRFPPEQKRPIGPLVVVGVRDGVLWLIDRLRTAHYQMVPSMGLFLPRYHQNRSVTVEGNERENLELMLLSRSLCSCDPSPADDFFSLCGEKKRLLAWGEGTR